MPKVTNYSFYDIYAFFRFIIDKEVMPLYNHYSGEDNYMPIVETKKIWMNGKMVNWKDANIHILSHVIHYGSCLFEGIRCYDTKIGSAVFRLQEHIMRLYDSCKIYRMTIPFSLEEIVTASIETVKVNGLKECYIRPLAYRGFGEIGVDPTKCPVDIAIAVWPWGAYLGPEAQEKGVDVMVSTWTRIAPNTLPSMAKASANYMNSQLVKMEALANGYKEGIALDSNGLVSEGSGENIFVKYRDTIYTPPLCSSVLPGVTRDSVMAIIRDMGIPVVEQGVSREMLYIADEIFFSGTAAEVTPIASVDKIKVGNGSRGPVTKEIQTTFLKIVRGEIEKYRHWLTAVER